MSKLPMSIYSVYDRKTTLYSPLFFFRNNAEASRAFAGDVNNEKSRLYQWPGDFVLCKLGEFVDDVNDLEVNPINIYAKPTFLHEAVEFHKSKE